MEQSIEYAQQKSYLDDLFKVYPTIPNGIRKIDETVWERLKTRIILETMKNSLEIFLS
jgi:type II site-specific deoxyribonuclease